MAAPSARPRSVADSVHNMRVVNTDAKSHSVKTPEKCLQEAVKGKNWMYLEACLQQRRHFSPFVASVDGLMGVEATATLKRSASCLSTKWRKTYSKTCGYVNIRIGACPPGPVNGVCM